jgi:hypothetical protein
MRTPILSAIMGLLLILLPTIAYGQSLEYVNSTLWTGANDIEVVGSYAYCAHPIGLMIFDISNPAIPTLCCKIACKGIGTKIAINGTYAYIATEKAGIQIVDISNVFSPILAGSYSCNGKVVDLQIAGDYAYIMDYSLGMLILNISNPTHPECAGIYSPGLTGTTIKISGDYAYIGYKNRHLHIVDIANPAQPAFVDDLNNLFESSSSDVIAIEIRDLILYVTTGDFETKFNFDFEGIYVFNVSDILSPARTGFGFLDFYFNQIELSGNYAFLGCEVGIYIYDVSDLSDRMYPVGNYHHENDINLVNSMIRKDNNLFIMFPDNFEVLNISTPISPSLCGHYSLSSYTTQVAIQGNYAYTCGFGWFNTIDISSAEMPNASRIGWHYFEDMLVSGNYCYLARTYHGLGVVNIENPIDPYPVDTIHVDGGLGGLSAMGDKAFGFRTDFYSNENNVTTILDISNQSAPVIAGIYNTGPGCAFHDALLWGNYVYIGTEGPPNIRIVNIENPSNPVQVNAIIDGQAVVRHGMCAQDHYLFASAGDFYIIDVSNPAIPVIESRMPLGTSMVSISGNLAFLAKSDSLLVVDIFDVSNPILLTNCQVYGGSINDLASNDTMCVVSVVDGIIAYKIGDLLNASDEITPADFRLSQNYPNPFNAQTTISYSLPETGPVNIAIYNVVGQKVAVIENGIVTAGEHRAVWDAGGVPSGLYFARLETGNQSQSIKLTVVK